MSGRDRTVHEELASNLKALLRPNQMDPLIIGKFMEHSAFFFDVLAKSMGQHLLSTGRIKVGAAWRSVDRGQAKTACCSHLPLPPCNQTCVLTSNFGVM